MLVRASPASRSLAVLFFGGLSLSACQCGEVPEPVDAGDDGGASPLDGGDGDAVGDGDGDGDSTPDAGGDGDGDGDAGDGDGDGDAGDGDGDGDGDPGSDGGFDWTDLFGDGGVPEELACLPGGFELSAAGFLDFLAFDTYLGFSEPGVRCGDDVCALGVPCCELCGYARCAEEVDGGTSCPLFVRSVSCDGEEDCSGAEAPVCCYSLSGTECRAAEDCQITLPELFPDGGFMFPGFGDDGGTSTDAGADPVDAGAPADAGTSSPLDAGPADDGGMSMVPVDAGGPDDADAGGDGGVVVDDQSFLDALQGGVPVCRSLFDCDVLGGELCCSSDRIVSLDLGLCLPALLCLAGGN